MMGAVSCLTCRVAIVSPSDPVYVAAQKMRELRVNSVIITTGNSLQGIFTYAFPHMFHGTCVWCILIIFVMSY
jgi:hypothetical protein